MSQLGRLISPVSHFAFGNYKLLIDFQCCRGSQSVACCLTTSTRRRSLSLSLPWCPCLFVCFVWNFNAANHDFVDRQDAEVVQLCAHVGPNALLLNAPRHDFNKPIRESAAGFSGQWLSVCLRHFFSFAAVHPPLLRSFVSQNSLRCVNYHCALL